MKDHEWNIRLKENGPVQSLRSDDGLFPVLKGGKAVLKGLVMIVDDTTSSGLGNATTLPSIMVSHLLLFALLSLIGVVCVLQPVIKINFPIWFD